MLNKEVFSLSHMITEQTPLYGGKDSISLRRNKSISKGDSCNTMHWSFPNHTGTHIDVPLHFIERGLSIVDFEPSDWIFKKVVLLEVPDIKPGSVITMEELGAIKDCELLLIKTGFEKYRGEEVYWQNSPGLHPDVAGGVKTQCPSIRAVGVDFISISNLNNRDLGRDAHRAFLDKNIILIEDMKLSPVQVSPDEVIVAPLMVEASDGAPCTVLARYN